MKKALCITPLTKHVPVLEDVDYIGVDDGAYRILEQNLPLKCALGDFDSMTKEKYEHLLQVCPVEKHPVMKDETDSELAVMRCVEWGYDEIIIYGAISGRLDHTLLNIRLLTSKYPNVILMDDTQKVTLLQKGIHILKNDYQNVSFLPMEASCISLNGFIYNLDHRDISMLDTYTTSNHVTGKEASVEIHSGSLLCIQTNEK